MRKSLSPPLSEVLTSDIKHSLLYPTVTFKDLIILLIEMQSRWLKQIYIYICIYIYTKHAHKKGNMKRLNLLASLYVGGLKKRETTASWNFSLFVLPWHKTGGLDTAASHYMCGEKNRQCGVIQNVFIFREELIQQPSTKQLHGFNQG